MTRSNLTALKQRLDAMPPRDRLALIILALFVAALLLIYLLILPAHRFANAAAFQYQQKTELLAWMKAHEAAARAVAKQPDIRPRLGEGQSILSLSSQQAQAKGISFKRFEPYGEGGLRIWLDTVPFNTLLQWLAHLQQEFGVVIQQVSIDRGKSNGSVNAKVELFLAN